MFYVYCIPGLSKANPKASSKLDKITLGCFFPHEIAAAFYNFRAGDLFYSLLTGTPAVLWWHCMA